MGKGEKYPYTGSPAIWDPSCSHEATSPTALSPPERSPHQMLCSEMQEWGITLRAESGMLINLTPLLSLAVCLAKIKGDYSWREATNHTALCVTQTPGAAPAGLLWTQNWGSEVTYNMSHVKGLSSSVCPAPREADSTSLCKVAVSAFFLPPPLGWHCNWCSAEGDDVWGTCVALGKRAQYGNGFNVGT